MKRREREKAREIDVKTRKREKRGKERGEKIYVKSRKREKGEENEE